MRRMILISMMTVFVGCKWDPDSLLGGKADVHSIDNGGPTQSSSTVAGYKCYELELKKKESVPVTGCELPEPLEALVEKMDTNGTAGSRVQVTFNAISGDEFPKIAKMVYKHGSAQAGTSYRTLSCRNVTPVDDLPKMRVFECKLVTKPGSGASGKHVIHSLELENEKCAGKVTYESRLKGDCVAEPHDYWSDFTAYVGKASVPSLYPETETMD